MEAFSKSRQITFTAHGHILTNAQVWSPDGRRIVYDTRSDPEGAIFDGTRIETVDVDSGEIRCLFESQRGARCGVATYHPVEERVIFILGPENPSPDWEYGPSHRRGVMVDEANPGMAIALDACDLVPPFTPGALRGGSHLHIFSPDGQAASFTYEDHVLSQFQEETPAQHRNLRCLGVSVPVGAVTVPKRHARNHDGNWFSVLVSQCIANPRPGSDDIQRAFEEAWIGKQGYVRQDGTRQHRALAFQGHVIDEERRLLAEVFVVDLPEDLTVPGVGPLEGTATLRPFPPQGTRQRRLTDTSQRKFPGIQGPRHWLRSSPDGTQIGFLMRDDDGIVQFWTVSPLGGQPRQITHNSCGIASAFTWSLDGFHVAHVMDTSVCTTEVASGRTTRRTKPCHAAFAPRPEACVISPDGEKIAYVKPVAQSEERYNQVFVCDGPSR